MDDHHLVRVLTRRIVGGAPHVPEHILGSAQTIHNDARQPRVRVVQNFLVKRAALLQFPRSVLSGKQIGDDVAPRPASKASGQFLALRLHTRHSSSWRTTCSRVAQSFEKGRVICSQARDHRLGLRRRPTSWWSSTCSAASRSWGEPLHFTCGVTGNREAVRGVLDEERLGRGAPGGVAAVDFEQVYQAAVVCVFAATELGPGPRVFRWCFPRGFFLVGSLQEQQAQQLAHKRGRPGGAPSAQRGAHLERLLVAARQQVSPRKDAVAEVDSEAKFLIVEARVPSGPRSAAFLCPVGHLHQFAPILLRRQRALPRAARFRPTAGDDQEQGKRMVQRVVVLDRCFSAEQPLCRSRPQLFHHSDTGRRAGDVLLHGGRGG
mmetsp:Transcript_10319/g.25364  ORF Transcript_10319/g.25364 Transcript_10319/m.25364 type:complete len:377 (+) Transcript_10319:1706-2836(+)